MSQIRHDYAEPAQQETTSPLKLVEGWIEDGRVHKTFGVPQSIGELALRDPGQFPELEGFEPIAIPQHSEHRAVQRRTLVPGEVPHVEDKVFPGHITLRRPRKIGAWLTAAIYGEPRAKLDFVRATHAVSVPPKDPELVALGWRL